MQSIVRVELNELCLVRNIIMTDKLEIATKLKPQVPPNCDLILGMTLIDKVDTSATVWQMVADERFSNPVGIMQGGFIAAFMDSAMGATSIRFVKARKVKSANAEMKVSFMKSVKVGEKIRCYAQVVSGGNQVVFVEATTFNEANEIVAKASSTYILMDRK